MIKYSHFMKEKGFEVNEKQQLSLLNRSGALVS